MAKAKGKKQERRKQPVDQIIWRHRDELTPNNYNPNHVAPPELDLLKLSILEDGWTQPIVVNASLEIVDGFHRWMVSGTVEVYSLTQGLVPTVMLAATERADQQMATVRHNRARGTHSVLDMSKIVQEMVEQHDKPVAELLVRLGMEKEEVVRLATRVGVPMSQILANGNWSDEWIPGKR